MAGEIATAFVSILPSFKGGASDLTRQLNSQGAAAGDSAGKSAASKFTGAFGSALKIGGALVAAFAVTKGITFFKDAIKGASDLNETISKSAIIFGDQAGAIRAWASDAATNMGLSEAAALEAAAGFGDMFSQIGFAGGEAAKLAKSTVQLSADLGSFNNLPTEDVAQRIAAAFRGEYDSLQTLIPTINAARVQTEALAMTGKKNAKELTAQEKAAAVLAIVNHDGARALGDFARTSDGAANTSKILSARFEDLKTRVGSALLPAFQWILGVAGKVLTFFTTAGDKTSAFGRIIAVFGAVARSVFGAVKGFIDDNRARFAAWGATVKRLFDQVAPVVIGMFNDLREILPKVAAAVGTVLGKAFKFLGSAVAEVVKVVTSVVAFFRQNEGAAVALRAVIVGVGAAFLAYKIGMLAVAAATSIVSVVTKAFAAVQAALNAVMAMNPIALVVLALVALAAGLVYAYKNSETFREIVDAVFKAVSEAVRFAWEGVIKPAIGALVAAFTWIVTTAQDLWAKVTAFWSLLGAATGVMKDTIVGAFNTAIEFISGIPGRIVEFLTGMWNFITTEAGKMKDGVIEIGDGIVTWFTGLPGLLLEAIGTLGTKMYEAGKKIVSMLWDGLKAVWRSLTAWFTEALDWLTGLWPFSPAKHGPLRDKPPAKWGENIMSGLAAGLRAGSAQVDKEMSRIAGSLNGTALHPTIGMPGIDTPRTPRGVTSAARSSGGTSPAASPRTSPLIGQLNLTLPPGMAPSEAIDQAAQMSRLEAAFARA